MLNKSSEFHEHFANRLEEWSLPRSLADDLANHLCPVTYERDAVIFLRGSPADFLFCVLNGFVKLYLPHNNGDRTLVGLARPGDFVGFVNNLDSDNRRGQVFEAHALTKCTLGLVSRDYLIKLVRALDSTSVIHLLENVNTMWSRMFEWYATFMGLSFRERLQRVLENLKSRVGVSDGRGVLLLPALTHEDLAEMIGSSRPMVSRLISDMAEDGLLLRGERQHYVLRSTNWPARTDLPRVKELPQASVSCLGVKQSLSANGGSRENNSHGPLAARSLSDYQSLAQGRRQSIKRAGEH